MYMYHLISYNPKGGASMLGVVNGFLSLVSCNFIVDGCVPKLSFLGLSSVVDRYVIDILLIVVIIVY